MKLLIDMNLSPRWVERLSAASLTAVHWSSVGRVDAPDAEIMAYAAEHGFVVLTHDLDFSTILAATHGTKPSVVQIRSENLSPTSIGDTLIAALQQMAVLRNYSITPTRAPADVRDASHPAPIRRAPRGARRSDDGLVAARTARRVRPGRQITEGRFEPTRSRHDHAALRRWSRNEVGSSQIQYLRSTGTSRMGG